MAQGKCCFCLPMRTGCFIIGYLNLIGATVMTLLTTVILAITVNNVHSNYFYGGPYQKVYEESKRIGVITAPVIAASLVFLIHILAFTIVLLVGLHQNKRGHVKAYLIYALIIIVLYIIYAALFYVFFERFTGAHVTAFQVVEDLVSILLSIFFWLMIRNYYLQMDDPPRKPTNSYNTAQVGHLS